MCPRSFPPSFFRRWRDCVQEPDEVKGFVRGWARKHREALVFAVGLALFASGALNLVVRQLRATDSVPPEGVSATPQVVPEALGPMPGEEVSSYIERKQAVLRERAAASPRARGYAVVSFHTYLTAEELDAFFEERELVGVSAQLRIPKPGFDPQQVPIAESPSADVRAAVLRLAQRLEEEAAEIERIIPTVADREFRAVYQQDAARRKEAIQILRSSPAVVFAVVVEGTNRGFSAASRAPEVRLVDLPEDPAITPLTHNFRGLLPP